MGSTWKPRSISIWRGTPFCSFNGEVGTVEPWGDGSEVPIYDRLFLGGSNNLRGFNFRDVGPKDQNGEPLGGQTLARATVEYTFPIIENVRGAVFLRYRLC